MAKRVYIKGIFPHGKCLFSCFFNENEKKSEKVWWDQIFVVPLQPLTKSKGA